MIRPAAHSGAACSHGPQVSVGGAASDQVFPYWAPASETLALGAGDDLGRAAGQLGVGKRPLPDTTAQRGAMQVKVSVGTLRHSSRVPHLTGLDVPRWRPGTTIFDGRTDARLRG